MSKSDEYALEDLLVENNVDLENLEAELGVSQDELESELEGISKNLQENFEALAKALKKEAKKEVLNYYHNNKKVVVSELKELNNTVHAILKEAKSEIDDAIRATDDSDEKKELKSLRYNLIKLAQKYNYKYAMLRMKLSLGNAEIDIKNFFHHG